MQGKWWLGDRPKLKIPGTEASYVHVGSTAQNFIVLLGWESPSAAGGIICEGTGFLLTYGDHGYVVTARHIARKLTAPFVMRVNRYDGKEADLIRQDTAKWWCHEDRLVDLAVLPLDLTINAGYDCLYVPQHLIGTQEVLDSNGIDVGDLCYTIGLFHFISGKKRNQPFVYSGNIALLPHADERVPVWDEGSKKTEEVEAYLIECRAINGASGAPVFVRPAFKLSGLKYEALVPETELILLGLFAGAWFLPPEEALKKAIFAKDTDVVPVGIGVVVPARKIVELLERDGLKKLRGKTPPFTYVDLPKPARQTSMSAGAPSSDSPPASDANPTHREDFTSLLNAAAKKPAREG